MARLYVARRENRGALYLPGTNGQMNLAFILSPKVSRGHLDELVRKQLEQQGITKETDVQAAVDKAEKDYENRVKAAEVKKHCDDMLAIRAAGGKIMKVGDKRWAQVFHMGAK